MFTLKNAKIALSIPNADKPGRYFSLRLKAGLANEPSIYKYSSKMLVISDIEGNFKTFCNLLFKAKVIDKYFQWTFGANRLVILGDCFDRGEQVMECLWLIYHLEERAKTEGGYVHFILGNHEIMNMNGDWRYVHPKYAAVAKSNITYAALYDGNNELWRWLRTKNIIEKIGNTLFVHGGISPNLLKLNKSISEINNQVRPYYTRANEMFTDPLLELVFNSDNSPFWYRGYYSSDIDENLLNATLKQYKVHRIITGHTQVQHITSWCKGKLINIDTDHAGENSEALLMVNHKYYRMPVHGKRSHLENAL